MVELGPLTEQYRAALSRELGCSFTDENQVRGRGCAGWVGHVAVDARGRGRLVVMDARDLRDLERRVRGVMVPGRTVGAGGVLGRVREALTGP